MKKKYFLLLLLLSALHSSAQSPLIPYRLGKLWGLADTLGKIKVIPIYDTIYTPNRFNAYNQPANWPQYFIVKKGGKHGILKNEQVLMQPKYHPIDMDSVFIFENRTNVKDPTIGGSHQLIYNLKAQLLIPDSLMEVEEIKRRGTDKRLLYTVRGRKANSGIFWYDPKQQKILQWIVTGADVVIASDGKDNIVSASIFMPGARDAKKVNIVFNNTTNVYDVSPGKVNNQMGNQGFDRERGGLSQNYSSTSNNFLAREIEFMIKDDHLVQVRRDSRYKTRGTKIDTIRLKTPGDSMLLVKYRFFNSVQWHSTIPYNNRPMLDKIDSGFTFVNYVTYKKNGKIGLIAENAVVPAEYQDLIYFKSGIDKPYFMASKISKADGKVRWGVINSNNQVLLACIYDQIIRGEGGGSWILKKDNLYGIANYQGRLIYPAVYEKISPNEHNLSYTITDKGKYGYVGFYGEKCGPIFPYRVSGQYQFKDYGVFQLLDKQGNSLGFADRKGFLYFKN